MALHLPMKLLMTGVTYDATIYSDDPAAPTATHVAVARRRSANESVVDLQLGPSGGEALYATPETQMTGKARDTLSHPPVILHRHNQKLNDICRSMLRFAAGDEKKPPASAFDFPNNGD